MSGRMTSASQKTVLVTGGAGYIGSHCCKARVRAFAAVSFVRLMATTMSSVELLSLRGLDAATYGF